MTIKESDIAYKVANGLPLIESITDVDDLLVILTGIDAGIKTYKTLKKHRADSLNSAISRLNSLEETIRNQIKVFMEETDEKTLRFPGTGKVTRKPLADKWEYESNKESDIMDIIKKKLGEDVLDTVIIKQPKINKSEFSSWLNERTEEEISDLFGGMVKHETGRQSISFTKDKNPDMNRVRDLSDIALEEDDVIVDDAPSTFAASVENFDSL